MNDKQARAETIVATILDLAAEHGTVLPLPKFPGTHLRIDDCEVRIMPGHRWSIAPDYRDKVRPKRIEDSKWQTIELRLKGREIFIVNVCEARIEVHLFRPGAWEKRFGSDPGNDVVPHLPDSRPIGPNAEAQWAQRNEDLQLPPERTGPATGDELRSPAMRQSRSRGAPTRAGGPYTVALRQQTVPGF